MSTILESLGGDRVEKFWYAQKSWSESIFGLDSKRGPEGPLKHLEKEVKEILENPTDLLEYVDAFFLIIDATRRAGFNYHEFMSAVEYKLAINKRRKWGKSSSNDPVEHIR